MENEQTHSGKVQHNPYHSTIRHIPTRNRFQILKDVNTDMLWDSAPTASMYQSIDNSIFQPEKVDATGQASKSKLPTVSQSMISNEGPKVVNQLTTALMSTLGMQEKSVQLGNKTKLG